MKKLLVFALIIPFIAIILYGGSADKIESQKAQCLEMGLTYKSEKRLNFRTGEYEMKLICINSYSKGDF